MLHVKFFDSSALHSWDSLIRIVFEVEFQRFLDGCARLLWRVSKAGDFHVQGLSHPFIIFLVNDNLYRALHDILPGIPQYDELWLMRLYSITINGCDNAAE
jgi:hypothetical protein